MLTSTGVVPFAMAERQARADGPVGSNDRIRIGLIGCGGMGLGNLLNFLTIKNVACVALCDVDDTQSATALKAMNRAGAPQPALITRDFRRVLDRKDVDAVVIATPDHWHALQTVMACQAGKDVYVQKPLATSIGEGRAMVEAARKYNRVVQVGTQQRSMPHFGAAIRYVQSGQLGRIRVIRVWAYLDAQGEVPAVPDTDPPPGVDYDLWLGPAPKRPFNKNRFHFHFRWFWDYAGGLMSDWGAHMIDIAMWGMNLGAPLSVASTGGKFGQPNDAKETPDTQQAIFQYPNLTLIWEHAHEVGRGPEARDHGIAFHGHNGVLVVDRFGWEVYPETDYVTEEGNRKFRMAGLPRRTAHTYQANHERDFVECMRSRKPPRGDVAIAHRAAVIYHLGNIAFRTGRTVRWDADQERVLGDSEAQAYVHKEYRAPWRLSV